MQVCLKVSILEWPALLIAFHEKIFDIAEILKRKRANTLKEIIAKISIALYVCDPICEVEMIKLAKNVEPNP